MAEETKNPEYYNEYGVNVTKRIEEEKTRFFKSRYLAEWWADLRRSYKYEVFDAPPGFGRTVIGYGVPK